MPRGKILKAVSLHQPWASAVPLGIKTIETRGFRSHHRGDLAICAAKLKPDEDDYLRFCSAGAGMGAELPLGVVVAIVDLYDVQPTEKLIKRITVFESGWGNYGPGRFGWLFRDIRPLAEPVPIRGQQGMWTVNSIDLQNAIWDQVDAFRRAHSADPGRSAADYLTP